LKKTTVALLLILCTQHYASAQEFSLSSGWQLLGNLEELQDMSAFDQSCVDSIWRYNSVDSDKKGWQLKNSTKDDIGYLYQYEGFWLHANSACELTTTSTTPIRDIRNTLSYQIDGYTLSDANTYTDNASFAYTLCYNTVLDGLDDWRVATSSELLALYEEASSKPTGIYWASDYTTLFGVRYYSIFDFDQGEVSKSRSESETDYKVLCIHESQDAVAQETPTGIQKNFASYKEEINDAGNTQMVYEITTNSDWQLLAAAINMKMSDFDGCQQVAWSYGKSGWKYIKNSDDGQIAEIYKNTGFWLKSSEECTIAFTEAVGVDVVSTDVCVTTYADKYESTVAQEKAWGEEDFYYTYSSGMPAIAGTYVDYWTEMGTTQATVAYYYEGSADIGNRKMFENCRTGYDSTEGTAIFLVKLYDTAGNLHTQRYGMESDLANIFSKSDSFLEVVAKVKDEMSISMPATFILQ
jgi:hypothetical protein